jgi:hypothetical protein
VAPVMWALRDFDGKGPCMGKILHIFHNLEKHVEGLRGEPFRLDHDMADPMEDALDNGKNKPILCGCTSESVFSPRQRIGERQR